MLQKAAQAEEIWSFRSLHRGSETPQRKNKTLPWEPHRAVTTAFFRLLPFPTTRTYAHNAKDLPSYRPQSRWRKPLAKTYLSSRVLKFPFSGSNVWLSSRASPKAMTSTERVRVKSRVTTNTTAQALNLCEVKAAESPRQASPHQDSPGRLAGAWNTVISAAGLLQGAWDKGVLGGW